jgi:hypothetical protein
LLRRPRMAKALRQHDVNARFYLPAISGNKTA